MNKQRRVLATNRQARHDYHILEREEAGIELAGGEVKSIREGRVNLKEAYVEVVGGEAHLVGCHVSRYANVGYAEVDPLRRRRLLLHKREILRLEGKVREKGLTVVPLAMVLDGNWVKVEIALVRGKQQYDHRETLRRRVLDREMEQAMKDRRGDRRRRSGRGAGE